MPDSEDSRVLIARLEGKIDVITTENRGAFALFTEQLQTMRSVIEHNRKNADMHGEAATRRMDRLQEQIDAKVVEQPQFDELRADLDGKVDKETLRPVWWVLGALGSATIGLIANFVTHLLGWKG